MTMDQTKPDLISDTTSELPGIADAADSLQTEADPEGILAHSFMLGEVGLLLTSDVISEVSDDLPLCRLPNTPAWLRGMANHHGNLVPVFDLERFFGFQHGGKNHRFLVVGQKEKAVGMLIERLPERILLTREQIVERQHAVPQALQPFVRACYEKDNRTWVDWDIDGFFMHLGELMAQSA